MVRHAPIKNSVAKFLCSLGGAQISVLAQCPGEINRYIGLGGAIFFTGLLAAISGGYAFYVAFYSFRFSVFLAVIFGAIWGFMIVNLDRYVISTMTKEKHSVLWPELRLAIPRIILAVLVATLVSVPLELAIFSTEIQAELEAVRQDVYKGQEVAILSRHQLRLESLKSEIEFLKQEIQKIKDRRDLLEREVIIEGEGRSITNKPGAGPVFRQKKEALDKAHAEWEEIEETNKPLIDLRQKEIEEINESIRSEKRNIGHISSGENPEQKIKQAYDGLLARLDALGRVTDKNITVRLANWFIILLVIVIEIMPIIAKLLSKCGPYDEILDLENKTAIVQAELKQKRAVEEALKLAASLIPHSQVRKRIRQNFSEDTSDIYTDEAEIQIRKPEPIPRQTNSQKLNSRSKSQLQTQPIKIQDAQKKPVSTRRFEELVRKRGGNHDQL